MPYRMLARAAHRATGRLGWLRGALGALLGIALAGAAARLALGPDPGRWPWLLAPLGASAVLVFAVPASPLAQPWPVAGGNLLSALVGLGCGALIPFPPLAAALAVGAAIAAMSIARCLHPPGGACALLAALGGPPITVGGGGALLVPLTLNVGALIAAGYLWNNLTGHRWPHHLPAPGVPAPQEWVARYDPADLDVVLENWDEVLDVSREDLDALFRAVEQQVEQRWRNDARPAR
ncbi:MAG: HPP family protein [Pseudomonadota bacterium]